MNFKAFKYNTFRKINYFLAKHFGLVELNGRYCIPKSWYIYDKEYEDDNIHYYEAVRGLQIFPIIKKVEKFELMHDSLYRYYIKQYCKEEL